VVGFSYIEESALKYMLMIYASEQDWPYTERQACFEESTTLAHDLQAQGHYISTAPLQPVSTATTVRIREGKRLVTDGPFAEAREQFGGYFMIEARNLDEAIEIAARIPGARRGTVEVRPVLEIPNLPESAPR
jgi:hypothetical protein